MENKRILNDEQIALLMDCVKVARLKKSHKGYRFLGEGELYKKFSKELGIIANPVCITGVNRDFDMAKATEFSYEPEVMSFEDYENLKLELSEESTAAESAEDKLISTKTVSSAQMEMFKSEFESAVAEYNLEVKSMKLLARISGTKLLVKFSSNEEACSFSMELPFIDKNLWCKVSGNLYSMAYMPLNLNEYVLGAENLMLVHPYQFLIKKGLMSKANKPYDKDFFLGMMKKSQGGIIKAVQVNIARTLRNAKEYSWSEVNKTPIMWVDDSKSELGKFLLENNIQLDFNYNELLGAHGMKGIDIITGSTSAPGKRCKVAKNYYIRKNNGVFELVKNEKATEDIFDFSNVIKSTIYPCFTKTSAKRDNSATIKDTNDLLYPSQYKKRFTIKG